MSKTSRRIEQKQAGKWVEINITPSIFCRGKEKAEEMGLLKNSITSGEGNLAGFIGEEVVRVVCGGYIDNTYDHDILIKGKRCDVKTKRCTSKPRDYYECSIAKYNTRQDCDYYIFVRVEVIDNIYKRAWVLGYYPKNKYVEDARKLTKGEKDGDNGFIVKADCYNMPISDLLNIDNIGSEE
jgi:hypothetical protein